MKTDHTPLSCPRLFEAEAVRDGRAVGPSRESFERHTTTCLECSRRVKALDALRSALRASSANAPVDELRVRRERTRLLAAFDRSLVAPEIPERGPSALRSERWLVRAAVAAALVVASISIHRGLRRHPAPESIAAVYGDSTAAWSSRREGDRETIVLERGALWIRVDHATHKGKLVVMVPDGELEDIGTTFTVSVEGARTTRVSVREGSVVLRLRGQPPIAIGPGDTWVPDVQKAVACASTAPSSAPSPSVFAIASPKGIAPPAASTQGPAPTVAAAVTTSSTDFRAAMAMLDAGDNAQAAAAFALFMTDHPEDSRVEDAAYLRVLAFQRSGDAASMKNAADDYLRRFPQGFRRADVETLSRL